METQLIRKFVNEVLTEATCRVCGDATNDGSDACEEHKDEPTKLELLPASLGNTGQGLPVHGRISPVDGRPRITGWRGF